MWRNEFFLGLPFSFCLLSLIFFPHSGFLTLGTFWCSTSPEPRWFSLDWRSLRIEQISLHIWRSLLHLKKEKICWHTIFEISIPFCSCWRLFYGADVVLFFTNKLDLLGPAMLFVFWALLLVIACFTERLLQLANITFYSIFWF